MFKHCGSFGAVCDFDWNAEDEWSLIVTSDDQKAAETADGLLSLFRPSSLVTEPLD